LGASVLCTILLAAVAPSNAVALTLSNTYFNVQTGSNGEITSLQLAGDNFPTNYVMNSTNAASQNTADHYWFGELMFTYRLGGGAWTTVLTNSSADGRTIAQSGSTVTVTYQNSANANGIKSFKVVETYSLVNDYLSWQIAVTNTSTQSLEIGDFGLPLPFNEYMNAGDVLYETRVVYHSFTGNNSSFITAKRPSGIGTFLLMTPDATTGAGFEYQDHWHVDEHTGSTWAQDQGTPISYSDGLNVFYIHSNVIKSTNRGYLPNTSLTLAANQSKTYGFKFFKVASQDDVKSRLYSEGLVDVTAVPGMMFATDMTAKVDLHTSKAIASVVAQYPSETTVTSLGTVATDHKIYQLKLSHLGQNNITVNYGSGETTVLQFYAIEPIGAALQRHATFMVQSTQWNDASKFYNKAFDDWMMDKKAMRGAFAGYMGWGDDWGLTHSEFLAEKNAQNPVAAEVTALDQYMENAVWNGVMAGHHTDYRVHDWFNQPVYTDDLTRGYAYPHVYNSYFSLYKIAKYYPSLVTYLNSSTTYLLRAYNVFKALYGTGINYNVSTGLMGEQTTPDIIQALKDEGYTTEANWITSEMTTKYGNFSSQTYPYGSEYSYDNTGEEAVYMLAKLNGNTTMLGKINSKTRACRGEQPAWYYYTDPVTVNGESWWNFQYTVSLAGYCMDDWVRNYSSQPEADERLSYAAKIANVGCINSGQIDSDPANLGTVSWTYQAEKGNVYMGSAELHPTGLLGETKVPGGNLHNGWRQMSGEADLGLFGAIRILSSDVAVDPIFGLFGYGCDVTQSGTCYSITPRDGVNKRLNLITQKLSVTLDRDQYTAAIVGTAKNSVDLTLKNQMPTLAHTTKLSVTGLAAGTYDVSIDNAKVSSVTATSGQASVVSLSIGTNASYDVRIGAVCGGGGTTGTGGASSTGGSPGAGGAITAGGTNSIGGTRSTGGAETAGGSQSTGGNRASGGNASVAGNASVGGTPASGGAPAAGAGGLITAGGALATGGLGAGAGTGGAAAGALDTGGLPSSGGSGIGLASTSVGASQGIASNSGGDVNATGGNAGNSDNSGSCSCRVAGRSGSSEKSVIALGALAALGLTRVRRRAQGRK
jgi:MYXO-CTERM domain-containing protein